MNLLHCIGITEAYTNTAKNWSAIKLEAYAIYYAVKHLSYYLLGQPFVTEMDHQNSSFLVVSQHFPHKYPELLYIKNNFWYNLLLK